MGIAFGIHPRGDAGLAHQIDESDLKHTRPNAPQHIVAGFAFQHDGINALAVQ